MQRQLARLRGLMAQLSDEIGTLNARINHMHQDLLKKEQDIAALKTANNQLQAAARGSGSEARDGMGTLINVKSMAPRVTAYR